MAIKAHGGETSLPYKIIIALAFFLAVMTGWLFGRLDENHRIADAISGTPLPTAPVPARSKDCLIWFIGSSSIANWRSMAEDMAPWEARNRGIGGATMSEITDRLIAEPPGMPPAGIVYYAGENDLAFKRDVDSAFRDFERFVAAKRARYGATQMLVLSLKASPTRWRDLGLQQDFNRRIKAFAARQSDLVYLDLASQLMADGRPGPYFTDDGIHLNKAGYQIWSASIGKVLPEVLAHHGERCKASASDVS
ncbi:GDSL-type esterase/lipase family protein [Sphingomonas sp. Y38-1Y]|uniref:GDSL-type esterase/lipase family protein n=1 Tax=Sphingomonas sp. Y38-1Y TaxID=3078265 RepID=UPI0028E2B553|nr:GDSL-type esterase/lipase family protein [Sphingomonas sp. Y38-1Y]